MTHLLRSDRASRRLTSLVFSATLAGLALLGGASACGGTAATAGSGGRGGEGDAPGGGGDNGATIGGASSACPAQLPKAGAPCSGSFSCSFGSLYCCHGTVPALFVSCRDGRIDVANTECLGESSCGGAGGTAGQGGGGAADSGGASGSGMNSSEAGQAGADSAAGGHG